MAEIVPSLTEMSPAGVPVYENVSVPPTMTFLTITLPSLVFVKVQVIVHGMDGDRPARHSVGELIGKPRAQLPFSFRYFQTIEQDVTLPEGFQPFEVEVQVRSAKLKFPMQERFPWKVATRPLAAGPADDLPATPRETVR